MNLLHADLPCSDILARQIKIPHPGQGQFTQMAMLHTTGHQRHGNVSLDAINTSPWRDHGQYRRRQLDELLRRVVFVPSSLPQLIQTRASNYKRRIELQSIRSKCWILKELSESFQITLQSSIRQIGHHVSHNLEATIFRKVERMADGRHGMTSIGLTGHRFIHRLNTNLNSSTAISQHLRQMWLEAVVWPRFDGNADAFGCGLFAVLDGLLDRAGMMARQSIVQISDEIILVFAIQAHECSSHDDVLDLVHRMAQGL